MDELLRLAKLTVAALAGSATACCMVGPRARSIHRGHLAVGHGDLVGVGLATVRKRKKKGWGGQILVCDRFKAARSKLLQCFKKNPNQMNCA